VYENGVVVSNKPRVGTVLNINGTVKIGGQKLQLLKCTQRLTKSNSRLFTVWYVWALVFDS